MCFSYFHNFFGERRSKRVGVFFKAKFFLSIGGFFLLFGLGFHQAHSFSQVCNLHPQNFFFVGREEILQEIGKFFKTNEIQILALVGGSGFGKTQIAQKYAYQNSNVYDVIWWIDTNQDLTKQMEELAVALNPLLPSKEKIMPSALSREGLIYAVKNILRVKKLSYLLVFDNATSYVQIEEFIPPIHKSPRKDILVTSRNANFWPESRAIGKLQRSESTQLVEKILPKDTKSDIERLASTLHDYPLGLAIATGFIKAHPTVDISSYISMYLNRTLRAPKGLAPPSNALLARYFPEAETPLLISLNAIGNQSKIALEALFFMSLLNSKNIPKEYIEKWFTNHDPEFSAHGFPTADEIIRLFHDQSLVEVTKQQNKVDSCYFLSLHDLIHELIQETVSMEDKKKHIASAAEVLLSIFSGSSEDFIRTVMHQPVHLLHAQKLCKNAKDIGYSSPQLLKLKVCIFECLMGPLRDYEKANALLKDIEEDLKSGLKLEPYFNALFKINKGYFESIFTLNFEEAILWMKAGLSDLTRLNKYSAEQLRAVTNLAQYHLLQGEIDKAAPFIERGKELFQHLKSSAYSGLFLSTWSLSLELQGKYEEALVVLSKERTLPSTLRADYPAIIHVLSQQRIDALIRLRKIEKASVLFREYDKELKKFYQGRRSIPIGTTFYLKSLLLLSEKKKLPDVFRHLMEAFNIYKEAFHGEKKHRNQARVHFALGRAYETKKDFTKALKEYLCSEEIYNGILKNKQIDEVSELYTTIAMLGVELKNDALSGKYFKAHLQTFGLEHFRTQSIIHYFYACRLPLPL